MWFITVLINQFGWKQKTNQGHYTHNKGRAMRNRVFGHMWTAKAQISLRGRAGWFGLSLSANRIIGHYRMYKWKAKARMRLCACVGWIWICAFCACSKTRFRWRGLYIVIITKSCLFKYLENFTSKNWKFSDRKLLYFSYFCSKHRLWVLVRTASPRRF